MRGLVAAVALLGLVHHGACQTRQDNRAENPCKRRGGTSAHETYCDKFYECVGEDEVVVRDCPNGLVYAGRKSLIDVCGYDHEYECPEGTQRNPPIATENCDWLYGIFGHETSCTRYWTCWNGTSIQQYCIGGLLFNEKTHSCDWPEFVENCQKHPLCAEDANGNVPLGKSCERYWSCQGGYPRLMRCPATLVFDKVSRRCVHPPTEDCEVPPTESPEELGEVPERQSGPQSGGQRGRRPPPAAQPAPQQLDEPQYYDDEEFESAFSSQPVQAQEAAPQQPNRVSDGRQPSRQSQFRASAPRPPLRGPAVPAGAIPIN